jgi:hypothetical protein
MSNAWFRLYSRIMTDPKVEMLSFEDQRHFVWLLCMKNEGYLDQDFPRMDMFDRMMGRKLGIQGEALDSAKRRLMDVGLIDERWQPVSWDDLQFMSDKDPTAAERKRKQRERERHQGVTDVSRVTSRTGHENVTRTEQNRTDTETENRGMQGGTEIPLSPPEPEPPVAIATARTKSAKAKDGSNSRATRLPADATLSDEWKAEAKRINPGCNAQLEFSKFADHFRGKGKAMVDWLATWRNWIRRAPEFAPRESYRQSYETDDHGQARRVI